MRRGIDEAAMRRSGDVFSARNKKTPPVKRALDNVRWYIWIIALLDGRGICRMGHNPYCKTTERSCRSTSFAEVVKNLLRAGVLRRFRFTEDRQAD
jgi:hypothetical protein